LVDTRTRRSTLANPAWGTILAARVLGEFGDGPHRYLDAKARKNYAGTAPITRASGTRKVGVCCIKRCRAILTANLTVQAAPCGLPTRHRSSRASLWAVGERGWPKIFLPRSLGIA
jgi:hypothetical protein